MTGSCFKAELEAGHGPNRRTSVEQVRCRTRRWPESRSLELPAEVDRQRARQQKKGQASGPYIFLFSRYEQLPCFEQFLKRELPEIRPAPWSNSFVASQEEFAIQKLAR